MESFYTPISIPISYNYTTSGDGPGGGNTSIISSSNIPWMDSRIWSRLPPRLIDRVIAFLPPPAFFRARAVCKRWYGLLFSHSFLELYLQVSPRRHWFLFFKQKNGLKNYIYKGSSNHCGGVYGGGKSTCEGYLFDPEEIAWYRVSFPLIPNGFSPASSSGGLICWVSDEAGSKNILLSNPVIGSLTQLPPTLRPRLYPSIGLNITNTSIDLAVAGDDLISPYAVKNLTAESFHMDGGGFFSVWGTTSTLPRLCSLESGRMIHVQGKFYCMNYSPFGVLSYEIGSNQWVKIQAPMRRFLQSPSLVESRGRLILVAAVEKSKLNVPKSLRMWALQPCGGSWVEIERMPQQLYYQFGEIESGQGFNCIGHGEFIVIIIRASSDRALLFDMSRKRWLWIPPCPFNLGGGMHSGSGSCSGGDELNGLAYEPRLATPVTTLLDHLTLPFQSFNG